MNPIPLFGELHSHHRFADSSTTLPSLASNLVLRIQNLSATHAVVLFSFFWFLFTLYTHFIRKLPAQTSPLLLLHPHDPSLVIDGRHKLPIGRVVRLYGADQVDFLQNSDRSNALMHMENSVDFRLGLGDVLGLVHALVLGTLWRSEADMMQEWFGRGEDFHESYLGPTMTTASALFSPARLEDSHGSQAVTALEDAQKRKLERITKTLLTVQPYERVLDLEFGWGFSGAYLIEKVMGINLVGVAVTEEQARYARTTIDPSSFPHLPTPEIIVSPPGSLLSFLQLSSATTLAQRRRPPSHHILALLTLDRLPPAVPLSHFLRLLRADHVLVPGGSLVLEFTTTEWPDAESHQYHLHRMRNVRSGGVNTIVARFASVVRELNSAGFTIEVTDNLARQAAKTCEAWAWNWVRRKKIVRVTLALAPSSHVFLFPLIRQLHGDAIYRHHHLHLLWTARLLRRGVLGRWLVLARKPLS